MPTGRMMLSVVSEVPSPTASETCWNESMKKLKYLKNPSRPRLTMQLIVKTALRFDCSSERSMYIPNK